MISGFSVLCCGRPRVEGRDDQIFKTVILNVIVGELNIQYNKQVTVTLL